MNRGLKEIYNQISDSEGLIDYKLNLYNADNNLFINIPLFNNNINLSLVYNHQNNTTGKIDKNKLLSDGAITALKSCISFGTGMIMGYAGIWKPFDFNAQNGAKKIFSSIPRMVKSIGSYVKYSWKDLLNRIVFEKSLNFYIYNELEKLLYDQIKIF